MSTKPLTPQQRRFVEAYQGNSTQAAIAAGYSAKTAKVQGSRLLTYANVKHAIQKHESKAVRGLIASREERQEKLTAIIRDANEKTVDRIKAIEVLGKMNGDFLERVEHSGGISLRWDETAEVKNDG